MEDFLNFVYDLVYRIFSPTSERPLLLLPEVEIVGLLSILSKILPPEQYQEFLHFPILPSSTKEAVSNYELTTLFGGLTYLASFGEKGFRKRMQPAFDAVTTFTLNSFPKRNP